METRGKLIDGVVKTINAGGSALVAVFDTGAGLVNCTLSKLLRCETSQLAATIKDYEARLHNLYLEIGRESSRFTDPIEAFAAEQVQDLILQVKEFEEIIAAAVKRLDEIAQEKLAAKNMKKAEKPQTAKKENLLAKALGRASARATGEKAISAGTFRDMSDKELFQRVARYLANDETELRILLIKDMGKTGSNDEVSSLIDALTDKDVRVRIAALDALSFIKDDSAVNPIVQLLSDDNVDVRARALDSLKSITGLEPEFDIHAEGEALAEWIDLVNKSLEEWFASAAASRAESACATAEAAACVGACECENQDGGTCENEQSDEEPPATDEDLQSAKDAEIDQVTDAGDSPEAIDEADETTPVWKRTRLKKIG